MTFEPVHLKRWTLPENYFGDVWPNHYGSGCGQSRDSSSLERSNFICMLRELGGESDTVTVVRESHWLVGWVEWIAIHQDDERALRIADEIVGGLKDYPVVDEERWSDLEFTEAADWWDRMSPRERVEMARAERARYHWLQRLPVWQFGRLSYDELGAFEDPASPRHNDGRATIARALEERLRT